VGDLTMKSEIEFRGKTAKGEWVYGYYVHNTYAVGFAKEPTLYENHYIYSKNFISESWFNTAKVEVIPETVGQYVGICDKNGKKVYEGDIVKTKYGRLCRVVKVSLPSYVGWDLEVFDENNALTTKKPDEYDLYYKDNLEVIGNIFDRGCDNE
jgi:uncharacterized phage protein (TIGR01671 family)